MVELIYYVTSISLLFFLGILTSITDIIYFKIFNKHLFLISICALILILFYYFYPLIIKEKIDYNLIVKYAINLIIGLFISVIFYSLKIWAAGDSKLFSLFLLLIPYKLFSNKSNIIFPGINILVLIFSLAFIYVIFESIYLFFKGIKSSGKDFKNIINFLKKINSMKIIVFILRYIFAYLFSNLVFGLLEHFFPYLYNNNYLLIMLVFIFVLMGILKIMGNKIYIYSIFVFSLVAFYVLNLIINFNFQNVFTFDYKILLIILSLILIRFLVSKYNYLVIPSNDVKEKMILSLEAILEFRNSRIKGLPQYTDESTSFRLSEEEVNIIKKWGISKKGQQTIKIVRHLPFAPFIFLGTLLYILIIYN